MTRRLRLTLVVVSALVVVGLLVLGGFYLYFAQKPPDFVAGPGKHRIHPQESTGGRNVRLEPNITVDGTPVLVSLNEVTKVDGKARAYLYVRVGSPSDTDLPQVRGHYAKGATIKVGGIVVTVKDLWDEPSHSKDAVDVEVTKG